MGRFVAKFDGGVVAEPETKEVNGNKILEFPVYVNEERKNKDTGKYDKTGKVTKVRVSLWRDLADTDIRKGDIVEIEASMTEAEWKKKDGTDGRQLQTTFVDSIEVKWRKDDGAAPAAAKAPQGFASAPVPSGFGNSNDAPWSKTAEDQARASVPKGF